MIAPARIHAHIVRPMLAKNKPQGVKAWSNPDREERRTFHAVGDGTFVMDGETVNLRHKMTKWEDCI